MKKIYILTISVLFIAFSSCSKDFLKRYDERIAGIWRISDVDRFGIGGSTGNLAFQGGTFTFKSDGTLTYVDDANVTYQGNWDIVKKNINDEIVHSLQITAVNYITQTVLTQYYDDMDFAGTNYFKARIISGLHTYVTHFRR